MTGTPRCRAFCSGCIIRGLFEPTFCPTAKMQSVSSKSSSRTLPTGVPTDSFSPIEVLSWHMLALSGRLLDP